MSLQTWRIHTESGSLYEVHQNGADWTLTIPTPPSSSSSSDMRGQMIPIMQPRPWPPKLGQRFLMVMILPDRIRLRRTTEAVEIEGPIRGGVA